MKSKRILLFAALLALTVLAQVVSVGAEAAEKLPDPMLYLAFDEGEGHLVSDASGNLPEEEIAYRFLKPIYTEVMEPSWREGVSGSSLLFDGNSVCITYPREALSFSGEGLTVSVWIAPRVFEWDDPHGVENGTAHLTAIAGQASADGTKGFLLGYQRFGRLGFQVGTGSEKLTLWADEERLTRNAWNHVAAVFDGRAGMMALYLNGAEAARMNIPAGSAIAPTAVEGLLIGKNEYGEKIAAGQYQMFAGLMDELKIYPSALSGPDIAALADRETADIPWERIALPDILSGDVYRPQYHAAPNQHWMNEPHAPLYYNGMYHLFFQCNSVGPYWRNICWGHWVSEDTVHWRQIADAIVPTENTVVPDGVWSGCAAMDVNGTPLLFFTAGNDSFRDAGLISNQNIGVAWPKDLSDPELTEWVIMDHLALAQQPGQGRPGEFRDPSVWREEDGWYMLICSGSAENAGGTALLYRTERLERKADGTLDMDWQYIGPLWEMPDQSMTYGTSWELPILLKLENESGTKERYAFFFSPAPASIADNKVYYFLGDFDRTAGTFTPDKAFGGLPRILDYGKNVFTGPSVLRDPVTGRLCVFSIMQDQRSGPEQGAAGWAHTAGLTRNLFLNEAGDDVCICPDPRLYALLDQELLSLRDATLEEANAALADIHGDLLYIRAVVDPGDAQSFSFLCKTGKRKSETAFTYSVPDARIAGATRNRGKDAPVLGGDGILPLKDGKLEMEIFIDRSLVEGFFNRNKALSIRAYDNPEAQQMEWTADGSLKIIEMQVFSVSPI